jgi:plastocyanin
MHPRPMNPAITPRLLLLARLSPLACLSLLALAAPLALHSAAEAQQQLGSVAVEDATVTGTTTPPTITHSRVLLVDSGTVTAKDHTAEVKLARGGAVDVCSTSGLHLTAGTANDNGPAPLMLSLDRGAAEIHMMAGTSDIIMTPDLRMSVKQGGRLDLRIRVTPNGDTCVENRIPLAATPALAETAAKASEAASKGLSVNVASLFGEDTYEVKPGQHVMFEHADLHEVVDNESSPCGCPAEPPTEVAGGGEFGLRGAKDAHPFPAAVSQGLAPAPPVPQAPEGVVHAQVSTTLNYSGDGAETPPPGTTEPPMAFPQGQQAPATPPKKPGLFHRLGRFFKRLF